MSAEGLFGIKLVGVKYSVVMGGFIGSVISLRYMKELTAWQAITSVASGTAVAHFLTPPLVGKVGQWLSMNPVDLESAVAFLIGLCALNIVAGIVSLSEKFKRDPESFIKK